MQRDRGAHAHLIAHRPHTLERGDASGVYEYERGLEAAVDITGEPCA